MSTSTTAYVVLNAEGEIDSVALNPIDAQVYAAKNKGYRYVTAPRLRNATSVTFGKMEITSKLVDDAIHSKLNGTSLTQFARLRGLKGNDIARLRNAVNVRWGYTKPWPKGCGHKSGTRKKEN